MDAPRLKAHIILKQVVNAFLFNKEKGSWFKTLTTHPSIYLYLYISLCVCVRVCVRVRVRVCAGSPGRQRQGEGSRLQPVCLHTLS